MYGSTTLTLQAAFAAQVARNPNRIALSAPGRQLTYEALDAQAEALSRRLRDAGVGTNVLVGICAEPGVEAIVGILAIIKAGGAYLPIDPAYPDARVKFLLEDSGASLLVATRRVTAVLGDCRTPVVWVEDEGHRMRTTPPAINPVAGLDAADPLAYVIYTSGSTGHPKGVLISQASVLRLFHSTQAWFGFTDKDVWTLFHSLSFDFSVWEMWGALLHGGRLVIVPPEVARAPAVFHQLVRAEGVTVLNQTPSAFRQFIAEDSLRDSGSDLRLRYVIFGGERLQVGMLAPWMARHGDDRPALINMYGITETTVHVTYQRLRASHLDNLTSPIGIPIPDLAVHLLDKDDRPVPSGTPGYVFVAGAGLARGYLNRPELTSRRFRQIALDGAAPVRVYDAGDLAIREPDGTLSYVGRDDHQLKVRGYRIEPGEVESCLCAEPGVVGAIVTAHDCGEGDVRLIASVAPVHDPARNAAASTQLLEALRHRAAITLPVHMRPSLYRLLSEIPLTPNGKADREAVWQAAERSVSEPEPRRDGVPSVIRGIAEIVERALRRPLGLDDDVFEAGATSLAFMRILAEINERFNLSLTGAELDGEATISRLAACVDAGLLNNDVQTVEG